jgi:putative intracellular protease/amidase
MVVSHARLTVRGYRAAVRDRAMIFDIVVFDGLDEFDALGPLEVLRQAGLVVT